MEGIIDFFDRNREQIAGFVDGINVNHEKTLLKCGSIDDEQVSLTFYIHGDLDPTIVGFDDKMGCLFNVSNVDDLPMIGDLITNIDNDCSFEFSPFLKIFKDNEPTLHAFHIIIDF